MTIKSLAVNGGGETKNSRVSACRQGYLYLKKKKHRVPVWLALVLSINVIGYFPPSNTTGLGAPASMRLGNHLTCFSQ